MPCSKAHNATSNNLCKWDIAALQCCTVTLADVSRKQLKVCWPTRCTSWCFPLSGSPWNKVYSLWVASPGEETTDLLLLNSSIRRNKPLYWLTSLVRISFKWESAFFFQSDCLAEWVWMMINNQCETTPYKRDVLILVVPVVWCPEQLPAHACKVEMQCAALLKGEPGASTQQELIPPLLSLSWPHASVNVDAHTMGIKEVSLTFIWSTVLLGMCAPGNPSETWFVCKRFFPIPPPTTSNPPGQSVKPRWQAVF